MAVAGLVATAAVPSLTAAPARAIMLTMLKLTWALLGLLNLATVLLFGWDKWRARSPGARRVPERRLLGCMLLGGFPGGWLAMQLFRHKTVKASFRRWALLCTLLSPLWAVCWWTWRELPQ